MPAAPLLGGWTIRITVAEGTEGTVTDLGVGNFTVVIPQPALTIVKSSVARLDYAYQDMNFLGTTHRVSVNVGF